MAAEHYYDSDGRRVPLESGGDVAVDVGAAIEGKVAPETVDRLVRIGMELRDGLVLVPAAEVDDELHTELDRVGALQPAYRSADGTVIVVLPEVRVESVDVTTRDGVRAFSLSSNPKSKVVTDSGSKMVLRPVSGRGSDALKLANVLHERFAPEVAQARFLRVVARPG